jgi:hypothetical protein
MKEITALPTNSHSQSAKPQISFFSVYSLSKILKNISFRTGEEH